MRVTEDQLKEILKDPDKNILYELDRGIAVKGYDPPTRSKLGAKKIDAEGFRFDSQLEYRRYKQLRLWQQAGLITDLDCEHKLIEDRKPSTVEQHRWVLQEGYYHKGKKVRAITYTDDFQYCIDGELIVEDIKGFATQAFRKSVKMFQKRYPDINLFVNYRVDGWWGSH